MLTKTTAPVVGVSHYKYVAALVDCGAALVVGLMATPKQHMCVRGRVFGVRVNVVPLQSMGVCSTK